MYLENRQRYEEIGEEVAFMFEECEIHSFPIDCFEIARKLHYVVIPYSQLLQEGLESYQWAMAESPDGFSDLKREPNGLYVGYIYYNDFNDRKRQRWTVFHEIGHLKLGHHEELMDYNVAESEANFFAKHSIAPQPLIRRCNCESFTDVAEIFDTSLEAGQNIFDSYIKWLRWGPAEYLPREEKILKMFPAA